jgi:hypothetical protein
MKLERSTSSFEGNLPTGDRLSFVIKSNPHLFNILSDGIYADKIAAVIRELSCNAHDSNVTARSTKPFTVNVPTQLEPNFWVEDTGLGIDPDKIVDIFWTYGASTKTNCNDTIGALGLGSKSPFAYTKSSFLVINRYNGVEYKYFCFINEAGVPDGRMMYQSVTDQPNGVRVELAVRSGDIYSFRDRIIRFFSFWADANMPTFNGDSSVADAIKKIKKERTLSGKTWELRSTAEGGSGAFAVMGGVPYPINRRSLPNVSPELDMVCSSYINITFPMGSLNFQVSREELSYDDNTIKSLEAASKNVAQEILDNANTKMVGFKTPLELARAYLKVSAELNQRFRHVATQFSVQTFKLADGREFTASELVKNYVIVSAKGHLPINIQQVKGNMRVYVKGRQNYSLESKTSIELRLDEQRDATGKITRRATSNTVEWFKASLTPVKQTNMTRKRTTANLLDEGYTVAASLIELPMPRQLMSDMHFIVNDLGARGIEGIRFYAERFVNDACVAFDNGNMFFVDGSDAGKTGAEAEAKLRELFANTLLEGVKVEYLSKLPNFKFPEPPKIAPKVRAPIQRGTIEQRIGVYVLSKNVNTTYAEDMHLKAPMTTGNIDYRRHDLTVPLLYTQTNWGAPLDKELLTSETLGALWALGLLDKFIALNDNGVNELRIAYMSEPQVEECKRRKMTVVNIKSLLPEVEAAVVADTQLVAAMHSRPAGNEYDSDRQALTRMTTPGMQNYLLPKLSKSSPIRSLAESTSEVKRIVANDPKRQALLTLIYGTLGVRFTALRNTLNGKVKVSGVFKDYPLLPYIAYTIFTQCDAKDPVPYAHALIYINGVDALIAEHKEAQRLAALESLHAEAIFEHC